MFQNLTIKSRLIFVLALLSVFMVIIGTGGLFSLSSTNASLKTVYDDRLVPMGQLDRVIRLVNRNQLTIAKAITGDPAQINQKMDAVQKDKEEADKVWAAYLATYLTPEEKVLADQFTAARKIFAEEALTPAVAAMRAQNLKLASEILHGKMDALYEKVRTPMNDLIKLQLDVAQKEFEAAQNSYNKFRTLSIALIVLGLILGAVIGMWLIRSISGPLEYAVGIARDIAGGDLTRKIEVNSTNETGQLLQALKNMNDSLVSIVSEVRVSTDTISTASSEIAAGNLDLSSRTEEQAASLEETASSMEELTSTVKQNADNARQANQLAMSSSEVAIKGGTVVGQVVETMGSINDSSKKIVDIIGVIDGIAFQTNILALNAAVEAARAGEQGRGFAVVAAEVRSLAQRSATAAKEIKALIVDSVEKVDTGSKLVDQAGATMQEVVDSIRRVTDIMGEITAASQEQTSGIEQINMAVTQMDQVTQQNAALVEEAAAAAASMQSQAGNLAKAVGVFKLEAGFSGGNMTHRASVTPIKTAVAKPAAKVVAAKKPEVQRQPVERALPLRSTTDNADWEEF